VTGGAGCAEAADVDPPSVTGGAVATGVFTAAVLPPPEVARPAKNKVKAATSATPTPASHRVVEEMRRMPLSRSAGRCGAT
jgi:hypothetical protein